ERNVWNYFTYQTPIENKVVRGATTLMNMALWGYDQYQNHLREALQNLPQQFPVLSIRSWKDQLVSVKSIDLVFEEHQHLQYETLTLPEGNHLQGLKEHPED